jgi:hypothetical protein
MLEYVALSCRGVALAKTDADAGTQLTIFDSSASEKQFLIFHITSVKNKISDTFYPNSNPNLISI